MAALGPVGSGALRTSAEVWRESYGLYCVFARLLKMLVTYNRYLPKNNCVLAVLSEPEWFRTHPTRSNSTE